MHFLPVFELTSDSLSAIQVEPHQCPSHQSILLTQETIHKNFTNFFCQIGNFEKLSFFESAILKFFLLHSHENQSKLLGYQGWVEIFMITLVYSKRVSVRNNLLHSVNIYIYDNLQYFIAKEFCLFSKYIGLGSDT
jgi:hypothetical protein